MQPSNPGRPILTLRSRSHIEMLEAEAKAKETSAIDAVRYAIDACMARRTGSIFPAAKSADDGSAC